MGGLGGRVDNSGLCGQRSRRDDGSCPASGQSRWRRLYSAALRGPITAARSLPLHSDADVDAEHSGEDSGRKLGRQLEQCGRPSLSGIETELTEALGESLGADGATGLATGEEPVGRALVANDSMTTAVIDETRHESGDRLGSRQAQHRGEAARDRRRSPPEPE